MKAPQMRSFDEMCQSYQQSDTRIARRLSHPDVDVRIEAVDVANRSLLEFAARSKRVGIDVKDFYHDVEFIKKCKDDERFLSYTLFKCEKEAGYYARKLARSSHCIRSLKAAEHMDPTARAWLLKGQELTRVIADRKFSKIAARWKELKEQLLELEILNCALERGVRRFGISHDGAQAS